jgi:superfamily II DNA/RNA helicase
MISRILQHRTNHEKTLVFAESILEAYYLDTALQLANIRVLLYHTNMSLSQRSLSITTFNTNATVSVMIMTTFSAAYGINLPVASRVYFISPVWQRDVERQAIKRAHRMGQTRPVYVETLVARGTVEEHMYACRNESTSKDMVENASMRRVLDSLHFIHSVQETRRKVLFTLQPKSSIHEGISTKRSVEQDDTRHVHIKL